MTRKLSAAAEAATDVSMSRTLPGATAGVHPFHGGIDLTVRSAVMFVPAA